MQTLLRFSVTQRLRRIKPKFTVRCFSDWDFGGFSGGDNDDSGGFWSRDSSGSNDSSKDGFFSNWFGGTEEGTSTSG